MLLWMRSVFQAAIGRGSKVNSFPYAILPTAHFMPPFITGDSLHHKSQKFAAIPSLIMQSERKLPHNLIREKQTFLPLSCVLYLARVNSSPLAFMEGGPRLSHIWNFPGQSCLWILCTGGHWAWTMVYVRSSHPGLVLERWLCPFLCGKRRPVLPSGKCLSRTKSLFPGSQTCSKGGGGPRIYDPLLQSIHRKVLLYFIP